MVGAVDANADPIMTSSLRQQQNVKKRLMDSALALGRVVGALGQTLRYFE